MKNTYLLAIKNLKGIGVKTTMSIVEYATKNNISIESIPELYDYLTFLHENQLIKRLNLFQKNDILNAYESANNMINKSFDIGIQVVSYYDDLFPNHLKGIMSHGKDVSPLILYYKGEIKEVTKQDGISIIGTREPTNNGIKAGIFYGEKFAKLGYNIVSGLAIGCDSAGHQGAINVSGTTTAILAHGLDTIYPKQNKILSEKILDKGGLLLSEYPIGTFPLGQYFVERDRLQAGLAIATIVIQTGVKGGTMHAVRATLENKKPLLVVKYQDDSLQFHPKVEGNYKLIREGAYQLRDFDKAIDYLNSFYGIGDEKKSELNKTIQNNVITQSTLNFD